MPTEPRSPARRSSVSRRDFLKRAGWGAAVVTPLLTGTTRRRAGAQTTSPYPDWMPPSTQPSIFSTSGVCSLILAS
jgi:hypothetical protein